MKPVSLTLRGFIGIKKGMGLDEITLDLSELSGLVALDGKNGKGKTTILDNLHPYRRLASRDGSLQHHTCLRDSYKEYTFNFAGHRYRTLVKIDAQSGRQEGFVWKGGESQVSGKATEYDKYIEKLLGSPKLFFHSVFAAQNGDSIADMTTGELKGLFTEFLRLDKLAEYEETAKQAGNAVKEQIDALNNRIAANQEQASGASDIRDRLNIMSEIMRSKKAKAQELKASIAEIEKALEETKEAAATHRAALARDKELEAQKSEIREKLELARKKFSAEVEDYQMEFAKLQLQIETKDKALHATSDRQELENESRRLEMAIQGKERDLSIGGQEYDLAAAEVENLRAAWEKYNTSTSEDIKAQDDHIRELVDEKNTLALQLSDKKSEMTQLENDPWAARLLDRYNHLQQTSGKLDQRDPECQSETCVFILDAIEAQKALPGALEEYEKCVDGIKAKLAEAGNKAQRIQEAITKKTDEISMARQRADQLSDKFYAAKREHETKTADAAKARDAAKVYIDELTKSITTMRQRIKQISELLAGMPNPEVVESEKHALESKLADLQVAWNKRTDEHNALAADLNSQIEKINTQQLNLKLDYEAEELVQEKAADLQTVRNLAEQATEEINNAASEAAVLRHKLSEIAEIERHIEADRFHAAELEHELSEWRYIQQACGKDGLRALEIDGTAPLIAGYANDLLSATFGPGATVGFRTLTDDGRECLDVVVYREDDEDENGTLLDNLSGGQKVWILKALRLALTLVSKQKSGKDIAAALSDEEDGALDSENAVSFIELYRAFLSAGGFDSILYITHRDECKSMADHVIRLTDQGIEIDSMALTRAA